MTEIYFVRDMKIKKLKNINNYFQEIINKFGKSNFQERLFKKRKNFRECQLQLL